MDFTFTEDQAAFRDSISRFLMTEAAPELLRDLWETKSGRSPELWGKIAEQLNKVPETAGFPQIHAEHPYNLSFIRHEGMQKLFGPMHLLHRR